MKIRNLTIPASTLLFAAIVVVNAGNYLINLLLGRILGPEAFAEAGVLATGVLMLSFVALGFQLTAAKFGAQDSAAGFKKWLLHRATLVGTVISLVMVLGSEILRDYLQFSSVVPFLVLAPAIPLYLRMSVGRGLLQGDLQFGRLAASYLLEMLGRLVITCLLIGLLITLGGDWATLAVTLGFLAAFVAAYVPTFKLEKSLPTGLPSRKLRRGMINFILVMGAYELSQILISHSDVILVKHYFNAEEAGLYAALALIGRVVFFATWSVVTLLFPKVIQAEKAGEPHRHLFYRSLLIVMTMGVVITMTCFGASDLIVHLLFGQAFHSIGQVLWLYALATTLFACANVFAYYYLSLNYYLPVVLSGITGILQIILISYFHDSIISIIYLQIILMGGLFLTMTVVHALKQREDAQAKNRPYLTLSTK
ncbi:sugar isomerase [Lewinella sp. W8]|uniref:sugar isomerase n=1 Tax=Lewinella sp. W8 TaxID=2528208 RepID=UPI001067DE32|nr:sugar isomerase [Lewinella sp. W8]MTB52178.1 sugar isomerase [Lewinella sp. W8]